MKVLGEAIFSKDENGRLNSRTGTMFFRTPGLVTRRGVHAMQRMWWIEDINAERAAKGLGAMSANEAADSVDLIFTEDKVMIRPDPRRMDLALKADAELQKIVPKHRIRFMNTHLAEVRETLRSRGENWRMAVKPATQDEIAQLIESSRSSIGCGSIYYYNGSTGTRWLTAQTFTEASQLEGDELKRQMEEIANGLKSYNRLGQPEIALFPQDLSQEVKNEIAALSPAGMSADELSAAVRDLSMKYRMAVPAKLRDESVSNLEWRNEMNTVLSRGPNERFIDEDELIEGISPEFYRQIEWLPGAAIEDGELIFDSVFDLAKMTQDPQLLELCDERVKSLIFNIMRFFACIEYINIGRINQSLSLKPISGARRGIVYIVQFKVKGYDEVLVYMLRFQKWGISEHLDEGKDLLQSIYEAAQYTEYILDRRLACCQLGMKLADKLGFGHLVETYRGNNSYNGSSIHENYFMRVYITGTASDKVPHSRYKNPAFVKRFAELMGEAAALDMVVGRRSTETNENVFDTNYEVLRPSSDGIPTEISITDHAGSFVAYKESFDELVPDYAKVVVQREKLVPDYAAFAKTFVSAFENGLRDAQARYRQSRRAYDSLFVHRPYDTAGSTAYRWRCILDRLDACDPARIASILAKTIQSAR